MKFVFRVLIALSGTLSLASGVTAVTDWSDKLLANVTTGTTKVTNEVFFWPDDDHSGRILSIGGATTAGSIGSYLFQTGGPTTWTAGDATGQVSATGGELFPVSGTAATLLQFSAGSLVATTFGPGGASMSTVDIDMTEAHAYSCITDAQGNVHVAYGFTSGGSQYVGYAQRAASGGWTAYSRYVGIPVTGTAVVATSLTAVKIYFTYGVSPSCSLVSTTISGNTLSLPVTVDGGGTGPLATTTSGSPAHLYYCRLADAAGASYLVRDLSTSTATASTLATLPAASPTIRGVRAANGPDGKVRIAIYVANPGVIYYLRGGDTLFGKVATVAGTGADLRGLMFNANGNPLVLYRKSFTESYVAFPADIDDADGNGRVDLLDTAFRGGDVTVPSIDTAVTGVDNSAGFFKLQFPVVGTPTGTTTTTLKNTAQNLMYTVQASTDLVNWNTVLTGLKFTLTGTGTAKSATGVFSDTFPGTTPKRFFRVVPGRITSDF